MNQITKLKFSLGGLNGRNSIELIDGELIIICQNYGNDGVFSPSQKNWVMFLNILKNLNVWKWNKDYMNHNVLDGIQWELETEENGQVLKCGGSNEYPEKFNEFLVALNKLVESTVFHPVNDSYTLGQVEIAD